MKIIAIAVLLALLILPSAIIFFYIVTGLLTKGPNWMDIASRSSPKLARFRSLKKLFYLILSLYCVIYFASLFWAIYQITGNALISNLGISAGQFVFIIVSMMVIWVGFFALLLYLSRRAFPIFNKFPPPDADPSSAIFLEWQKNYSEKSLKESNYMADHIWHYLSRYLFICFGVVLLMGLSIWVIFTFVH